MDRRVLGTIFLTIFLDLVGFGIVLPLLPRFAAAHGASEWQIGLLMATYSLAQFVFAPFWGGLSDRVGRRPVLLFSIGGSVISYVLFTFASTLEVLFISRAIAGAMAANIATAQAYVADTTAPEDRAKGMGIVGAAFGLGFVFGPAIAGITAHLAGEIDADPQIAVGLVAAAFSLLDLCLAGALLRESLPRSRRGIASAGPQPPRLARMAAALTAPGTGIPILLFLLTTLAWSQLEPTLARLAQERFAFNEARTGYVFAYLGLVVAVVQGGVTGRLAQRVGERPLIVLGTVLLGVGLLLLASVGSVAGLHWALLAVGLGQALNAPGIHALISRAAAATEQGSTFGVTQGFSSLARLAGPIAGGWLFGLRHEYPFWFGALLMLLGALLAIALLRGSARD
ncbi:MAG: MFS transporter [Armatimonadota bacterium]